MPDVFKTFRIGLPADNRCSARGPGALPGPLSFITSGARTRQDRQAEGNCCLRAPAEQGKMRFDNHRE